MKLVSLKSLGAVSYSSSIVGLTDSIQDKQHGAKDRSLWDPVDRLSSWWTKLATRQLFTVRYYTLSYRIVSYRPCIATASERSQEGGE